MFAIIGINMFILVNGHDFKDGHLRIMYFWVGFKYLSILRLITGRYLRFLDMYGVDSR